MTQSSALSLKAIRKEYNGVTAVKSVDLDVAPGELVALLGPSGCGKTTTLRMVAGFETPTSGQITIGGDDVTHVAPNHRNLGMVFQNYSLFPHRTVAENIAFGLRMAGKSKAEQAAAVERMLELVQLKDRGAAFPRELSGGQQQRVALARSLVVNPRVLLLDEPLGALDKALRESMQLEIRSMQQRLGITTLLVTHDQEEAMTMSDRIAVMYGGKILQIGAPAEIYDRPQSRFVAEFLGASNIFEGIVDASQLAFEVDGLTITLPEARPSGSKVIVSVRPERICVGAAAAEMPNRVLARISGQAFRGTYAALNFQIGTTEPDQMRTITSYRQSTAPLGLPHDRLGETCWIGWAPEHSVIVASE